MISLVILLGIGVFLMAQVLKNFRSSLQGSGQLPALHPGHLAVHSGPLASVVYQKSWENDGNPQKSWENDGHSMG